MEISAKQKGNLTELQCITAFYELGYKVSIPYGEDSNYDFIADVNNKLLRIQVKSAKDNHNGSYSFSGRHNNKQYAKNSIDYFATFILSNCYLIPVNECSVEKKLWLGQPKNGQQKGITFAAEYLLQNQLQKLLER